MRIIYFILFILFCFSCSKSIKVQNESETYFGHDLYCKRNYPKKIKKRIPLDSMKSVSVTRLDVLSPKFSSINKDEIAFTTIDYKNINQKFYIYNLADKNLKLIYESTNDFGSINWTNSGNLYYKAASDTTIYEINVKSGKINRLDHPKSDREDSLSPNSYTKYFLYSKGKIDSSELILKDSNQILDTLLETTNNLVYYSWYPDEYFSWHPAQSKLGIIEIKKSQKITTLLHIFEISNGKSTKHKTIQLNKNKYYKRYEFTWIDEENLIFIDPFNGICKLNITTNEYKIIRKFCKDWSILENLTVSADRKKLMFYERKISYNSNLTSVTATYILYTMNIDGSELKELHIE